MSTPLIHAKPEDLDTPDKRGNYTVSVIGCGLVGILHAVMFAEAGFKINCFDSDPTVVASVARGKAPFSGNEIESRLKNQVRAKRIAATSDIKKAVSESDIVVVTIPAKVDSRKKIDYSSVEGLYKLIGSSLKAGSLLIAARLAGIDAVEGIFKETLENTSGFKVGRDIALAYSPFHFFIGPRLETALNRRRILAAPDENSLNIASTVLDSIKANALRKTKNLRAAEVAALFEVQNQDVNFALANELSLLCEKTRVDFLEVNELLRDGENSLLLSPTLSNGVLKEEPYLLLAEAENINLKLRIPEAARDINEQTVKRVASLVKDALRSGDKTPRRARISVLGISQTPNMKGQPKRMVKEIVSVLTAKGARINLYDPYFSEDDLADMQIRPKRSFAEAVEGVDCIVILTAHDQFKRLNFNRLKMIMRKPGVIVDLEGIIEPGNVEKEGFIYRGLGRGVWTK